MKELINKFYKVSIIAVLLSLMNNHQISFAYEVKTHSAINQYIAQNNIDGFSLNDYLKKQLGMQEGTNTYFKNGKTQEVFLWIGDGGVQERNPVGRP